MSAKILSQGLTLLGAAIMLLGAAREFAYNRKATGIMLVGTSLLLMAAAGFQL